MEVLDIKERLTIAAKSALDKNALEIVLLDVMEASSFTDYLLICAGKSDRQVKSIADSVEKNFKRAGILPLGIEGFNLGEWVLMDYSDIVINIFYEPVRVFYDLESLWSDVPRFEISEPINLPL